MENTAEKNIDKDYALLNKRVNDLERLYNSERSKNADLQNKIVENDKLILSTKAKSNFMSQGGKAELFVKFHQAQPKFSEQDDKEVKETKNLFSNFFNEQKVKPMDVSGSVEKSKPAEIVSNYTSPWGTRNS